MVENPKLYIIFHRIINYEIKAGGKNEKYQMDMEMNKALLFIC